MKKMLSALLVAGFLFGVAFHIESQTQSTEEELEGTISLSGAWALYPMVVKWAEEFQKLHPDIRIDVAAGGAGKGMADCLAQVVDIGMVSRDIYPAEIEKGAWWVSVTKDAVVPTMNRSNPVSKELLTKGVKRETFVDIWITGKIKTWGQAAETEANDSIHVYTRSDACGAAKTWAQLLGAKQEDLLGVGVYGDPGLAEAVKRDILGIGFNNINYAYDARSQKQVDQVRIVPIDLNGNGVIDTDEDFYSMRDEIVEAIAAGKYPSPPARLLHLVSQGKPQRKIVREFIQWILTDGQRYVPESGYISLTKERIHEELKKLCGE
ncbi:MAG: PstS family phosphate ABC transporter substrate-binding protein [Phycisphaerales bacterium]|nr:MAG: PstS family phosphate ABC transporter substrate-binding protein [Phycisphaerales bacterium]